MKPLRVRTAVVVFLALFANAAQSTIIEIGDLNIISDPGNPSNGLRYLDMSFSDGRTLASALANAQASYTNARLATPEEFDNLFAAAGISFNSSTKASDAFATGPNTTISSGANYDGHALATALGFTFTNYTNIWTDPDQNTSPASTRDFLRFYPMNHPAPGVYTIQWTETAPHHMVGWMLVSDAVQIFEPASLSLLCFGAVGLPLIRRRNKALKRH